MHDHSSSGTCRGRIIAHHGAGRMLSPWAGQLRCREQMQLGRTSRRRRRQQPPAALPVEQRRLDPVPFQQCRHRRPMKGKAPGTVKLDDTRLMTLRDEVVRAVRLEHTGIGKMKRLLKNEAVVAPRKAVRTCGMTDCTDTVCRAHHFEEHVPRIINTEHERVCHKPGRDIRDIITTQDWICDALHRSKPQWVVARIDTDAPVGSWFVRQWKVRHQTPSHRLAPICCATSSVGVCLLTCQLLKC